jgi:homoserine kinase type II
MAVYTDVSDEDLDAFVADYDIGTVVAYKGIAEGVENSNYLLQTQRSADSPPESYILTLYEKRVRREDLPYFLGLMEHLAGHDFTCPLPIAGRDGETLRELAGRPAAIISFLAGMWPRRILPAHCAGVGTALAHMHLAGADFPMRRANDLSVEGWARLIEATRERAHEVVPGLADEITEEFANLSWNWPADLPAGIIHADLFPDNVFFLGQNFSGFIDFYFACNDLLAYDLAICLNAWCFETDGSFNITKARTMLRHYDAVRPIGAAELAALPLLARGSALRFLLTRLYDWLNHEEGALVRPKDPREFLDRLRFHRQVASPAAYGLDMPGDRG